MRLYVLDSGSLAGLHYFGAPGEPDAMLLGCNAWLLDFMEKLRPTHAVLCLDSATSRRKAADATYKANRQPLPDDYAPQLQRLPALFAEYGIMSIGHDGEEADDVIASMVARHGGDPSLEIVIVSADKDLNALVGNADNVKQYLPNKGVFLDESSVAAKYGFLPYHVPTFLALAGDTSDGVKGISGVGAKTATKAIQQTRGILELFRKAAAGTLDLPKRAQKLIAEGRAQFDAAMQLVKLRHDLPVPADIEAFRIGNSAEHEAVDNVDESLFQVPPPHLEKS